MKVLLSLLLASLLALSGCTSPKVVAVVENEAYKAVFTDAKCDVKPVLENLQAQAEMAKAMGMPAEEVEKILSEFKRGDVDLKDRNEKRAFCYRSDKELTAAFVIDEKGGQGIIQLKTPKKD